MAFEIKYRVSYNNREKGGSTFVSSRDAALDRAEELCGRFRHVCIYEGGKAPIVIMHHGRPVWNPSHQT